MQLLTELNNCIVSVGFEVDFGFSLNDEFTSNYKKRFHNSGYTKYSVSFHIDSNGLQLFDLFYNQTLNYGVLPVEMDLFLGDGITTYIITENPIYSQVEADLYSIELRILKKKTPSTIECRSIASTINEMFLDFSGINTSVTGYISATDSKKKLTLALYNMYSLISLSIADINTYEETYILTNNEVN
jgi:hypothetical protein